MNSALRRMPFLRNGVLLSLAFLTYAPCNALKDIGSRTGSGTPPPPVGATATAPRPVRLAALPSDGSIIFSSMRWKPNRSKFVNWEIYVMNENGGNARQMTFGGRSYQHAAVSPNHRLIAAVSREKGPDGKEGKALWVYDLVNRTETRLLPSFQVAGAGGVDWSPDGFIYFAARLQGQPGGDVYKIRPDGSELTRLTNTQEGEMDVSVSEDGRFVAFVRLTRRGKNPKTQIWSMNADGTGQRMVYDGGPEWGFQKNWPIGAYDPEFSPDNSKVIFSRTNTKHDNFGMGAHDICITNADGTGLRVLTPAPGPVQMIPDWKDNLILYTEFNERGKFVGIVTIRPDGSNPRRIEKRFKETWDGGRHGKWIPRLDTAWPYGGQRTSFRQQPAPAFLAAAPSSRETAPLYRELVTNGGMEKGSTGDAQTGGRVVAWRIPKGLENAGLRSWSSSHARSGSAGKAIRASGGRPFFDFQYLDDPQLPGARVVFSAWIRANKAGSHVTARLRWGGPAKGFVDLVEGPLGDQDWHFYSKIVQIPASAREVAVACWANGNADGAFDEVSVKIQGPSGAER